MAKGANLTTKQTYYPLTYMDISPGRRLILDKIVPTLLTKTVLLVGEAGEAKTPANIIMAMGMARYQCIVRGEGGTPSYRISADLDFFRGEAGTPGVPCVLAFGFETIVHNC